MSPADLGTLEVGKTADLLVLRADPLLDITNMRQIDAVMKDGTVIDRARLPEKPILHFDPEATGRVRRRFRPQRTSRGRVVLCCRRSARVFATLLWMVTSVSGRAQRPDAGVFGQLRYRFIGPPGNRVSAVAGVTGQPNIYYVGAASGGIWKSTDAGTRWEPNLDDQPVSSIGSLAVAPSDPNVVSGRNW